MVKLQYESLTSFRPDFQALLHTEASPISQKAWPQHQEPDIAALLVCTSSCLAIVLLLYLTGMRATKSMKSYSLERQQIFEAGVDLSACILGLLICNCSHAITQEFVMTKKYGEEEFPSVPFLVFCNTTVTMITATVIVMAKGEQILLSPMKWSSLPAASFLFSINAQYACLRFVTFPTLVVFKSAKIVPTMLMNALMNNAHTESRVDYVLAVIISGSVAGFSLIMEAGGSGGDASTNTCFGICLLILYLVTDALSSTSEKKVFTTFPEFSPTQMMLAVGVCSFFYSICYVLATGGFSPVVFFLRRHPEAHVHIIALAVFSSSGQWLILYVIRKHGPVVWAVISTVRQIISINISAVLYGHLIGWDAISCAALAFTACLVKPLYILCGAVEGGRGKTQHLSSSQTTEKASNQA